MTHAPIPSPHSSSLFRLHYIKSPIPSLFLPSFTASHFHLHSPHSSTPSSQLHTPSPNTHSALHFQQTPALHKCHLSPPPPTQHINHSYLPAPKYTSLCLTYLLHYPAGVADIIQAHQPAGKRYESPIRTIMVSRHAQESSIRFSHIPGEVSNTLACSNTEGQ